MRKASISYFERETLILKLAVEFAKSQGLVVSEEEMNTSQHPTYVGYKGFAKLAIDKLST